MYLSREIFAKVASAKDDLIGEHTYVEICQKVEKLFKKYAVRCEFTRESSCKPKEFQISGYYDDSLKSRKKAINFVVSDQSDTMIITEKYWERFVFLIGQTLQHEMVHEYQYQHDPGDRISKYYEFKCRNEAKTEEREYLSDWDEIEAYAHDIALEIINYYPDKDPHDVLRNLSRVRKCYSLTYYRKTFRGTDWSEVKKRLYLKIYKWLPYCNFKEK